MALCDSDVVPVGKVRFSRCHSALSGAAATATTRSDGANVQRISRVRDFWGSVSGNQQAADGLGARHPQRS